MVQPQACAEGVPYALFATENLKLQPNVAVRNRGAGYAPIASAGTETTYIGDASATGDIVSEAPVEIRNDAAVHGYVESGGDIVRYSSIVPEYEHANIDPSLPSVDCFTVDFPDTNQGDVHPEPSIYGPVTASVDPGSYNMLVAKPGVTLQLRKGTYYAEHLEVHDGGALELDTHDGPIYIYVNTNVKYDGAIIDQDQSIVGDLFLGYLGSRDIFFDQSFTGTVVAPSAMVTLHDGGHTGSFFARRVLVDGAMVIEHAPFLYDWVSDGSGQPGGCGDGVVDPGEECDDGNLTDGDGCSSTCQLETTEDCTERDAVDLAASATT